MFNGVNMVDFVITFGGGFLMGILCCLTVITARKQDEKDDKE